MAFRGRSKALALFAVFTIAGCGSSSENFVFTNTPPSGETREFNPVVVGMLNLGRDIPGASLRLESHDGTVLGTGTADDNGIVFFRNVSVPSDFRAVATLPNSPVEFKAEVRGYSQNNKHVRVSLPTTLAFRYREAHPEVSVDQSESAAKQLLNMPEAADLSIGPEGINPFFSDVAFLRAAGAEGDLDAFTDEVVTRDVAQPGAGHYYLLSPDQLDRPISGLDPGLLATIESVRQAQADRLHIEPATGQQLDVRYTPTISLVAGPASLGGQFLLGVGTGLAGNLLTGGTKAVVGWAANQMGLNYGTSGQLEEISAELAQLTSLVEGISLSLTVNNLTDQKNQLDTTFSTVDADNQDLRTALGSTTISNQPVAYATNSPVGTLLGVLSEAAYQTALSDANTYLRGQSEFLVNYANSYMTDVLGVDTPSNTQGMPWRANHVLDDIVPAYTRYAGYQTQAINLLAETLHAYPNNPTPTLQTNLPHIAQAVSNLKLQRQQLPLYASQWGVLVDLENGVMWWEWMYKPTTWDNVNSYLVGKHVQLFFPDGSNRTYDDWRLPTLGEVETLRLRGSYNPTVGSSTTSNGTTYLGGVPVNSNNGPGDIGRSTAGLPSLGFYQVAEAFSANEDENDNGSNGNIWFQQYQWFEPQNTYTKEDRYEYRMNRGSGTVSYESDDDDENVWVVCRTLGPDVVTNPYGGGGPPSGAVIPDEVQGSDLTAGEICQWGVPTAISVSTTAGPSSISYPANAYSPESGTNVTQSIPEGAVQFLASVTYQVSLGGSYTVGSSGTTGSDNKPSFSYTGDVSTRTVAGAGVNYLSQLVSWSVDQSDYRDLFVFDYPYLSGIAIPYTTTPVTVTATLLGAGGNAVTGTLDYSSQAVSPHTLTSIQVTPRNRVYREQDIGVDQPFYCTGFYSDGTIADLSEGVSWTVAPVAPATQAYAEIKVDGAGVTLDITDPPAGTPVYNITVGASINGFTDSVAIQISPD